MSKKIAVGNIYIGGGAPVTIQSMLNVLSENVEGNINQAKALQEAGCEIIRVAVPTLKDVQLIYKLKEQLTIPVIADIHFDHKIALECAEAGVDKIRINPGNIGNDENVSAVAKACNLKNIPIRIGINSGSLEKSILKKYGHPTAEALLESGIYHAKLLEKFDFNNIIISLKSSNVDTMYKAYVLASEQCDYPLHLGVTEAGTEKMGTIKSAAGIGGLLLRGIGDTIRISLTDDPIKEIEAGINLLKAIGVRKKGATLISCPTCGRTKIDIIGLAKQVEKALIGVNKNITVAVMGCVVNGPGEAREADIGICGGEDEGLIIKKGVVIKKVPYKKLLDELMLEIEKL